MGRAGNGDLLAVRCGADRRPAADELRGAGGADLREFEIEGFGAARLLSLAFLFLRELESESGVGFAKRGRNGTGLSGVVGVGLLGR